MHGRTRPRPTTPHAGVYTPTANRRLEKSGGHACTRRSDRPAHLRYMGYGRDHIHTRGRTPRPLTIQDALVWLTLSPDPIPPRVLGGSNLVLTRKMLSSYCLTTLAQAKPKTQCVVSPSVGSRVRLGPSGADVSLERRVVLGRGVLCD